MSSENDQVLIQQIREGDARAEPDACVELARRHGDYALVGLAAAARAEPPAIRLAYFGVGTTPVRARAAETALAGGDLDAAVAALAGDLEPSGDVHASAAAKRHLAVVLLRRVAAQLSAA